jgi:hypothetical protein
VTIVSSFLEFTHFNRHLTDEVALAKTCRLDFGEGRTLKNGGITNRYGGAEAGPQK